jgi:hypothetical protein
MAINTDYSRFSAWLGLIHDAPSPATAPWPGGALQPSRPEKIPEYPYLDQQRLLITSRIFFFWASMLSSKRNCPKARSRF